jgi:biotin operon repressor
MKLQVIAASGLLDVDLEAARATVGRATENDLVIDGDRAVSRVHAVVERLAAGWCLRDLGSTNGTFLNGQQLFVQAPLGSSDEIRVGRTRIVVGRGRDDEDLDETDVPEPPPHVTAREYEVLLRLVQPAVSGVGIQELAPPRKIAETLGVTETAVRQHLLSLYRKFGIDVAPGPRMRRLAGEALRRRAIDTVDILAARSREC